MIDREKLNKQIKVISQESWSVETNTTVNAMVEYIVNRAFDKLLDHLEPVLEAQSTVDPSYVAGELEDLKMKLRYLNRDIEQLNIFMTCIQNNTTGIAINESQNDASYENAKGNGKVKRNATKGNVSNPNEFTSS